MRSNSASIRPSEVRILRTPTCIEYDPEQHDCGGDHHGGVELGSGNHWHQRSYRNVSDLLGGRTGSCISEVWGKVWRVKEYNSRPDIDIYFGSFLLTALVPEVSKSLPQKRRSPSANPGPNSLPFLLIFGRA
jgi:hypothetical protein